MEFASLNLCRKLEGAGLSQKARPPLPSSLVSLLSALLLFRVRAAGFSALCSPLLLIGLQSTRLVIVADSSEEAPCAAGTPKGTSPSPSMKSRAVDATERSSLRPHFSNMCVLLFQVSEFNPLTFTSVIECERPNNDLTRFRGCM